MSQTNLLYWVKLSKVFQKSLHNSYITGTKIFDFNWAPKCVLNRLTKSFLSSLVLLFSNHVSQRMYPFLLDGRKGS